MILTVCAFGFRLCRIDSLIIPTLNTSSFLHPSDSVTKKAKQTEISANHFPPQKAKINGSIEFQTFSASLKKLQAKKPSDTSSAQQLSSLLLGVAWRRASVSVVLSTASVQVGKAQRGGESASECGELITVRRTTHSHAHSWPHCHTRGVAASLEVDNRKPTLGKARWGSHRQRQWQLP